MKGELRNEKVLVRGKEVFIGVDVHKESWHVTHGPVPLRPDVCAECKKVTGHDVLQDIPAVGVLP